MATVSIGYKPELTKEQAQEIFAQGFSGKYEVVKAQVMRRDFILKKSAWAGVGVRLQQDKNGTSFVYTGMMPNMLLQALFGGLASYLFLRSTWKQLEQEVAAFIAAAPEFQQDAVETAKQELKKAA
jgi:hypothetical protein